MKNVKVILWGLGAMGGGIGKMLCKKQGVDIVGAIDIGAKLGKSLYDVVPGIERGDREDVIVGTAEEVIRPGAADIVVVCTNSFTRDVYDKLVFVMERGMNVITSAEEMAYPQAQEPELAAKLDEIARRNGVTVLGTGINPGQRAPRRWPGRTPSAPQKKTGCSPATGAGWPAPAHTPAALSPLPQRAPGPSPAPPAG